MNRTIAIIGAGMAGLTCAEYLRSAGVSVIIFEKSRGLGGRMATRHVDNGLAFDHGAQFIRSRSADFATFLDQSTNCDLWEPSARADSVDLSRPMFVGRDAMHKLMDPIATKLDVRLKTTVSELVQTGEGWLLGFAENSEQLYFDTVVSTVPVVQAQTLLARQTELVDQLSGAHMAPCWALMLAFDRPLDRGFDVWRHVSDELGWAARNTSKPGRPHTDCWVVHATPEWSDAHLELNKEEVANRLLDIFAETLEGPLPDITHCSAHRWRYAQTIQALGRPFVSNEAGSLFVGGDWCLGARVEAAFDSGKAVAEAIVGRESLA